MYLTIELLKQVGEQQRFSIFNNLVGKPQMVSLSTVEGGLKFILSALLSGERIYLSDGSKART
jgi:ABC-type phosphonate transport system ATPase subunit